MLKYFLKEKKILFLMDAKIVRMPPQVIGQIVFGSISHAGCNSTKFKGIEETEFVGMRP
jgi:hypothetical protein